jgi:Flp pilus assembly protein TadB
VTAALLVGLCFGTGLLLVVTGLRPAPLPLPQLLSELDGLPTTSVFQPIAASERRSLFVRLFGEPLSASPAGRRIADRAASDLRITGTTTAEHLSQRMALAVTAIVWAPLCSTIMWAGGVSLPVVAPLWFSFLLAPAGFLYPTLSLRSKAASARRTFRHALSAFLDIVAVSLAGGRGVESALHDGAEAGQGWPFAELRRCLLEARLMGEPPWAGLARLGRELGIPELGELAASATLAGSEGARVRASLAAKAKAMRQRSLTDVEAAAQAASERMSLPVVLLMLGFIVFLGFPALEQVLAGL